MLNLGIIGGGRIGKVHAKSIQNFVSGAKVKTVADPFVDDEMISYFKELGVNEIYEDYKKIINDKEIDAVLVCSSTNTHADISIEALKAGKDVFCEKPVDADVNKIKEVIKVVEETGKKFKVGFNRRFDSNFSSIKKSIKSGKIGDVHIVKITSRDPQAPPIEYVKVSGGMFMDMTIHDFDMVRFLSGSEPVEVFAKGSALIDKKIGEVGDIDTAVITITMEDGSIAVIDNSRQAVYGYDQRAEVFGSKGMVKVENKTNSSLEISNEEGVVKEKPLYFFLERYMDSFAEEMRQFCNAIINNDEVAVDVYDGLAPVYMAIAAKKSIEEGKPVKISEVK